jgi:hypothetical protein
MPAQVPGNHSADPAVLWSMSRIKLGLLLLALIIVATGWYFFRPERAFIDARVSEAPPISPMTVLAAGDFHPEAHKGMGRASVIRLADGRRLLRFERFETLNGPDVRVYLLGSADVRSREALAAAGYLDLGALKGNIGDQSYEIPAGADLTRFPAVAVWCRRFGVNFTTAPLRPL